MKLHKLANSIFQKDHFSTFIGLIIGLLSIPILLTAVYEPQKLTSFAMMTDEGGGSFVTTTKITPIPNKNDTIKPITSDVKDENKEANKPENECDSDEECGSGYLCRFRGGARRCLQKQVSITPSTKPTAIVTTNASGGGRPYAYQENVCETEKCSLGSAPQDVWMYLCNENGTKVVTRRVCIKESYCEKGIWRDRSIESFSCDDKNVVPKFVPQCFDSSKTQTYFPCENGTICHNGNTCVMPIPILPVKQGNSLDFAALLSCTNNVNREGKIDFFKINWECYFNKITPKEKE